MISTVDLATGDGTCRTTLVTPRLGAGPWPAAVLCIDGAGPREVMTQMAERLADEGYVVAVPDLFHRAGSVLELLPPSVPHEPRSLFGLLAQPDFMKVWRERFYASATDPEHLRVDVEAVLEHLGRQAFVRPGPVGVTGYCMGGHIALKLAALFGERIGAVASFHGGMLATDAPDSPHLGAPRIKAEVYVACAVEDRSCTDEMKQRLIAALQSAGVTHQVETYPDARHGFAVPDSPAYRPEAAERHHRALEALFGRALHRA